MPVHTNVALPWYREEDWQSLMEIFADGDAFETEYEGWRQSAEGLVRILETDGQGVRRVVIEPVTFAQWCAERGLQTDADARIAFADEAVTQASTEPEEVELQVVATGARKNGKRKGQRKPGRGGTNEDATRTH